ncbi:MAG: peptidase S8 [Candidatus Bathyarchaeota archaeon]|nr:MAG: peptidase S8 [Candidatus Bathyarchaeota archaeon]
MAELLRPIEKTRARRLDLVMRKACLCLIFVLLAIGLSPGVGAASTPEGPEFVPGEVIVGLETITAETVEGLRMSGGRIIKEISALNAVVVEVTVGNEDEYIQSVSLIAGVRYAERNGIGQMAYTPNDPLWGFLWNMRIIEADSAWDVHKGSSSVVIAILDTGVDYTHPDLAANYVSGGYDWINNDNDPMDDHSHGTHCAGIAAAVMDNNIGVVGVAQAGIWAEKILTSGGFGSNGDLASGITHAAENGVEVISMSLQRYPYSTLVEDACEYAWDQGVLLVAAAGNDRKNIDISPSYPASYNLVMAVSATTSGDRFDSSYSNYGTKIELAAPGTSVYSTVLGSGYGYMTGTSMACPHVAGTAALLWSYTPSLTNTQLRERLHKAVDDLGTPGRDIYYGYGRINVHKALSTPTISLYTDKHTYEAGDTMHLGLDATNPDGQIDICFVVLVVRPGGLIHLYIHMHDVVLPADFSYSNPSFRTITLPSLPLGTYKWHAALLHPSTHATIATDSAEWQLS